MWDRVKAFCLNSTTIAWSYFIAFVGALAQGLDSILDILNDQAMKDNLHSLIGDTKTFGQIMLGISIVNIIARLRSLRKVP
jgi:hypothetical protein